MEKKNNYLKICLDTYIERMSQTTKRRAVIFSIAISVLAFITVWIVISFLK